MFVLEGESGLDDTQPDSMNERSWFKMQTTHPAMTEGKPRYHIVFRSGKLCIQCQNRNAHIFHILPLQYF